MFGLKDIILLPYTIGKKVHNRKKEMYPKKDADAVKVPDVDFGRALATVPAAGIHVVENTLNGAYLTKIARGTSKVAKAIWFGTTKTETAKAETSE